MVEYNLSPDYMCIHIYLFFLLAALSTKLQSSMSQGSSEAYLEKESWGYYQEQTLPYITEGSEIR